MPFEQILNDYSDVSEGYIWKVDPDVEEDFSALDPNATTLQIEPEFKDEPTRIPSLDFFNTGHLRRLEISDMDVTEMPRIPESVRVLVLTNLTEQLNGISLIIPEGVKMILLRRNRFDIIRLPSTLDRLSCCNVSINLLTGHVFRSKIVFGSNTEAPKYLTGYRINQHRHFMEVQQVYNDDLGGQMGEAYFQVNAKWNAKLADYIKYVNTAENAKIYAELAEIKHRIRNPSSHSENPIVQALFLGSNYLRRAAEFMTEETLVA
jgi:hypothetical protein